MPFPAVGTLAGTVVGCKLVVAAFLQLKKDLSGYTLDQQRKHSDSYLSIHYHSNS